MEMAGTMVLRTVFLLVERSDASAHGPANGRTESHITDGGPDPYNLGMEAAKFESAVHG
ncbi:MAG: hypothetical protein ACLQRH_19450 [Acidimicrobiales bacterium]